VDNPEKHDSEFNYVMLHSDHYQVLGLTPDASQNEIKQAYRRLAKQYHPDRSGENNTHEKIIAINAAYEVLSNPTLRASYDRAFSQKRSERNTQAQQQYHNHRQKKRHSDDQTDYWLKYVYHPIIQQVEQITAPLEAQIDHLAGDPFDDELLDIFQTYLESCRGLVQNAKQALSSQPNPVNLAGTAANLYHCLNQLDDGIEELAYFPFNFDEHHLHTGKELFRIATGLQEEAQIRVSHHFSKI
jgi:molecular chaperone DnaJ